MLDDMTMTSGERWMVDDVTAGRRRGTLGGGVIPGDDDVAPPRLDWDPGVVLSPITMVLVGVGCGVLGEENGVLCDGPVTGDLRKDTGRLAAPGCNVVGLSCDDTEGVLEVEVLAEAEAELLPHGPLF